MNKKLTVYTMEGCSHCSKLKKKLTESNIDFINKDIDVHSDEYDKIVSQLKTDFIPLVLLPENVWLVPERDFLTIDECFNKIKSMI